VRAFYCFQEECSAKREAALRDANFLLPALELWNQSSPPEDVLLLFYAVRCGGLLPCLQELSYPSQAWRTYMVAVP
jgi:hypothetical protein